MIEFLQMGGYGAYVWAAYGIACLVLGLNFYSARSFYRKQLNRAAARHQENHR
ncbi:MAG: heme exporter protein CcmD [Flavobacteriales bacterium]|nr:heme exporter protein CcmD [Flavobacteriales bacterium]